MHCKHLNLHIYRTFTTLTQLITPSWNFLLLASREVFSLLASYHMGYSLSLTCGTLLTSPPPKLDVLFLKPLFYLFLFSGWCQPVPRLYTLSVCSWFPDVFSSCVFSLDFYSHRLNDLLGRPPGIWNVTCSKKALNLPSQPCFQQS